MTGILSSNTRAGRSPSTSMVSFPDRSSVSFSFVHIRYDRASLSLTRVGYGFYMVISERKRERRWPKEIVCGGQRMSYRSKKQRKYNFGKWRFEECRFVKTDRCEQRDGRSRREERRTLLNPVLLNSAPSVSTESSILLVVQFVWDVQSKESR